LNLAIAPMPQIQGNPVANFANYWGWTVSRKSASPDLSWNFLNFLQTSDEAKKYVDSAKRPAARKALLPAQLEDEDVGVFASQVLTARSWYRGNDPTAAEGAFNDLISAALTTEPERLGSLVNATAEKISQTF
jgi:ABC-type glycerol-3-phosphate transport system substrate-binding protein